MTQKIKVLHPITRLIIGGAQENTMLTADYLNHLPEYGGQYDVHILCGPQVGAEGSLIEEVRRRRIPLTILPELVREINPAKDTAALLKLRALMRRERYHIVHTHSSKAGVLGRLAARAAHIPHIVHTVHGWSFHDQMSPRQRRLYVTLEKIGARCGHAAIVVSPHDIEKGIAQGIGRPQDYTLIRSGIELDRFGHPAVPPATIRQQLAVPADGVVVGSVTRLSPQKAPLDLIAAFAQVHRRCPAAHFVIVGDGPLRPQVEAAIHHHRLADHLTLTGLRRDIPELLAAFDLFALSSLWEGLPRVLPQAMATALPIVCTRADGSAEAVADGENGYLVPRGDPAAMAEKIVHLLHHADLRRQFGENGRARVQEFSARKMVADIHTLYQRLRSG